MRDDTNNTQIETESWEEPQDDDDIVIPADPASSSSRIAAGEHLDHYDDICSPGAQAVAELPIDTLGWTNALATMSVPQNESFGAWIDAISDADLPTPHDNEIAELFSEDDSQIGFDSDEQVVL